MLGSLSNGYLIANFKKKMYKVHRLIWIYHNGNIDENLYIDHINRNSHDNRLENLRWTTSSQNALNKTSHKGIIYNFSDTID